MAKFVPDVKTKRWIIISPVRAFRPRQAREDEKPADLAIKEGFSFRKDCPFCLGNEGMTPPEIQRKVGLNNNWQIRVVPNLYPITDLHEVIIHSPDHKLDICDYSLEHVTSLIKIYKERYLANKDLGTVLIFNNKGWAAGESLLHPHSQLVVIPSKVVIDVLELESVRNIVLENKYFVVYCPDFSQWPYEVWITLKDFTGGDLVYDFTFGSLTEEQLEHLAEILQKILKKLANKFPDFSYNYYIYPYSPFYLRIIPRLTSKAGFELGTGLNVNVVDPMQAAEDLKNGKSV